MKLIYIVFIIIILTNCKEKIPASTNSNLKPKLDLQGHRGARGLKPENTLPAFESAMKFGMTTIELDTVVTKDKKLIIHHDTNLNPEICQKNSGEKIDVKRIAEVELEFLKSLDCGSLKNKKFPEQERIPKLGLSTLNEFFKFVKDYEKKNQIKKEFQFNIETKFEKDVSLETVNEFAKLIVEEIEKENVVNRSTVQSFDLRVLPIVKKLNPNLKISALIQPEGIIDLANLNYFFKKYSQDKSIEKAVEVKAEIISPNYRFIDEYFIKSANSKNLLVIPWTINEKSEMQKYIELGVDGIISDYPNLLIEVYKERYKK